MHTECDEDINSNWHVFKVMERVSQLDTRIKPGLIIEFKVSVARSFTVCMDTYKHIHGTDNILQLGAGELRFIHHPTSNEAI